MYRTGIGSLLARCGGPCDDMAVSRPASISPRARARLLPATPRELLRPAPTLLGRAVGRRQILRDGLGICLVDRRAEDLDHLGNHSRPLLGAPARVHHDVVRGVADLALGLGEVAVGTRLEPGVLVV